MTHKYWQGIFSLFLLLSLLIGAVSPVVAAPQAATATVEDKIPADSTTFSPTVILPEKSDSSPALHTITPAQVTVGEARELPRNLLPKADSAKADNTHDTVGVQTSMGPQAMPAPLQSFNGIGNLFGGWPPDTEGDIGPQYYVQWINLHLAIWSIDKVNNTATMIYGPVAGNTLFAGFGGPCQTTNDGDPIVLYDPMADRWLMSQFALPNYPNGPFYQCIAVSKTGDPTGQYWRYQYSWPGGMNDYPKFGVWPDAYYMTANQFNPSWAGAGVAAYNRSKMMAGDATAEMVYFNLYSVNVNFGGMLPADFDGTNLPPAGAPGLFVEWDDSSFIGDPVDTIRVWEFHVNFTTPASSTFGLSGEANFEIPSMDVDPNLCGYNRACIPQPNISAKLDAISDRLMYRLQYRNFGSYQTLVTNHTVDATGTDLAGIHWFELRDNGSGWDMQQEGVYAPDTNHRWMGAAAMDHVGDLALGYSVSSSSVYPSVRYAGRLVSDPPGTLPQAEVSLVAGSGSQTDTNYSRWGDYSMMGVDPSDDCTFWYTQEYVAVTGSNTWTTRIGSFKFPGCSVGPTGLLSGAVTDAVSTVGIDGASVQATLSPTQTFTTNTLADGSYQLTLPVGSYDVTASAYGYLPSTVVDVVINTDQTTTRNFALGAAAVAKVEGNVIDGNTGWPLYAKITIDGFPGDPIWTDPVTGYYSVNLVTGITYTFHVESWVEGYLPVSEDVLVNAPLTKDFALDVDENTCNAPGYALDITGGVTEHFNGTNLPAQWSVINNGGDEVWRFDNPKPRTNNTGGTGNFAIADSDYAGPSSYMDTELRTPVMDLSGLVNVSMEFKYDYYNLGDTGDVDISNDGGTTWTNIWHRVISDRGPKTANIDITSYAAGHNDVVVRWHYYNASWAWYWEVDDVVIGSAVYSCTAAAGGLVVGNVFDANTDAPLVGADVSNDSGGEIKTVANPDDLGQAPSFYTLFSPAQLHEFTASEKDYTTAVDNVDVVGNDTVGHDFFLAAGLLTYLPPTLEATVNLGESTSVPLTLSNDGGAPVNWELLELNKGMVPFGPIQKPDGVVKPFKQGQLTTKILGLPTPPEAAPFAAGDIIQSWPTGLTYAWGLGFDQLSTSVWLGNIAAGGGDDLDYRFLTNGTNTGDTINTAGWIGDWAGDMAFNINTGMLWQMNVAGDNCIYELDPVSLISTGKSICPGFTVPPRGLAYDPSTDTYFAGGWDDQMVFRFSSNGNIIVAVDTGLPVAGLAYNPDTEHLFVMSNASPNPVYVLDVANNYAVIGQFSITGFTAFGGAGLEMSCDGHLWAVDQATQVAYELDSGETTSMCSLDVPWLSENPTSGSLNPASDQVVQVTFDANVPEVTQPGTYLAQLKINNDTPYDVANIPVTMTVEAPAAWGKLLGNVTSLGYCDVNPVPLAGAEVLIEGSDGYTRTLVTDDNGAYQIWLDQIHSPLTLTVTAAEHETGTKTNVVLVGGQTTTADLDLRWMKPCTSVNPVSLEVTVVQGDSLDRNLRITNDGAGDLTWELQETSSIAQSEMVSPRDGGGYSIEKQPSGNIGRPGGPNHSFVPQEVLLDEGFEAGLVPPVGWELVQTNASQTWKLANYDPYEGLYYANVEYDSLLQQQDEVLLSPMMILKSGILDFWSLGSLYWCRDTYDNCDLNIWIVVGDWDGGTGNDIFVGKADDDWTASWTWSNSTFDITSLLPAGPVRIAFQYTGLDGAEVAIDSVLLDGVAGSADVPWLTEVPTQGVTLADDIFDVTISFDSMTYTVGTYQAVLLLKSDDPEKPTISIPVTMNVVAWRSFFLPLVNKE